MAAHLAVPCTFTRGELATTLPRSRFDLDRFAQTMAARRAVRSSSELVALLRDRAEVRRAPPVVGRLGPYTDALIHHQDMLIPLGLTDGRSAERWRPALDFLVSARGRIGFVPARLPGVRLVATDVEWMHGDGPQVEAPAAALALAVTRRTPRLDELTGPGAGTLRAWAGG